MGKFNGQRKLLAGISTLALVGAIATIVSPNATAADKNTLFSNVDVTTIDTDAETNSVELGLRIRPNINGTVTAIRFAKPPEDTAKRHAVSLWSSDGTLLGNGWTTSETKSGWQKANLTQTVALAAGKTYVVSYHTDRYVASRDYFRSDIKDGPITIFGTNNGVYKYSGAPAFPTDTYRNTNYWVGVVFKSPKTSSSPSPSPSPSTSAPSTSSTTTKPVTTSSTTNTTNTTIRPTPATAPSTTVPVPSNGCANTINTPGGSDGNGGCFPYAGNTGVPTGMQLSNYSGSCTITTAGTVIDKQNINCNLDIRAKNVVIKNSKINGAILIDSSRCSSASYDVSDSTIHVADINLRGLMSCNFTANRVDVSGGQSMAWCDTCTIQNSYLHNPLEDPAGAAANHAAHNSTVRVSKNATLLHNTFWCAVKEYSQPNGQDTSGCSANQTAYSHDGAAPHNSLIQGNLYMPTTGGYCAYGGSTTGDLSSVHDIVFKDNVFKRGTNKNDHGGYTCGYYGAVSSFDSSRPGNLWINNKWDDGTVLPSAN